MFRKDIPATTSGIFFARIAVAACSREDPQPKLLKYDVSVSLFEGV